MYLLPSDRIDQWWKPVSSLLGKAWNKTNVGQFLELSDVYSLLKEEKHFCFVTSDLSYAGVFRIKESPKASTLFFWLSGGEEPSCGWEQVDEFMVELSKVFGCKYIQLEGRLGWKRKVEPLGYRVDSLIMIKEVNDELL